jgi:multiple sugar transport system permease protein
MQNLKAKSKPPISLYLQRGLIYTILGLLTVIIIFIFYILIVNATRSHYDIQKGFSFLPGNQFSVNFSSMLANANFKIVRALLNSMFIAFLSATLATYFNALAAYGIHMYDFKMRKPAFTFILLIMMIPVQVSSLGLVRLLYEFKLIDSFMPLIVPSIAAPAVFFFMKQYLDSVLPFEVIESARIDGSSEIHTFHKIVVPMIAPAIAVQFIFSFVASWNNYFMPSLIIQSQNKRTIPLVIAGLKASSPDMFDLGPVYMLLAVAIIPLLVIYLIFSRKIIKGITLGSVKG